jgi:hypothetical protein
MIAVAVAGILFHWGIEEGERRKARFESLVMHHCIETWNLEWDKEGEKYLKLSYHQALIEKYEWASQYPWLPVWPDPVEPIDNSIDTTASGR